MDQVFLLAKYKTATLWSKNEKKNENFDQKLKKKMFPKKKKKKKKK